MRIASVVQNHFINELLHQYQRFPDAMCFMNLTNALEGVVARDLLEKRTFLQIETHLDDGKMMGVEVG